MADSKITALTALTSADPANDMIPIVDVSDTPPASGNTKRISINNILAASGTATLASATITGDLTVDTSTLKVDSVNNRVGVVTASPADSLEVVGSGANGIRVSRSGLPTQFATLSAGATGPTLNASSAIGELTFGIAGTAATAMTLNATGLGLGVSPVTALSFPIGTNKVVGQSATSSHAAGNVGSLKFGIADGGGDYSGIQIFNTHDGTYSSQDIRFFTGQGGVSVCTERMRIDSSGNVGIGLAPSAWGAGLKAVELGAKGNAAFSTANAIDGFFVVNNAYYDTGYKYGMTGYASRYTQYQGQHQFFTAPSGTAGNAITFTERLRLKETGQLRFIPLAADPAGAESGDVYYNSVSNKLKCYNGTTWNDLF